MSQLLQFRLFELSDGNFELLPKRLGSHLLHFCLLSLLLGCQNLGYASNFLGLVNFGFPGYLSQVFLCFLKFLILSRIITLYLSRVPLQLLNYQGGPFFGLLPNHFAGLFISPEVLFSLL